MWELPNVTESSCHSLSLSYSSSSLDLCLCQEMNACFELNHVNSDLLVRFAPFDMFIYFPSKCNSSRSGLKHLNHDFGGSKFRGFWLLSLGVSLFLIQYYWTLLVFFWDIVFLGIDANLVGIYAFNLWCILISPWCTLSRFNKIFFCR